METRKMLADMYDGTDGVISISTMAPGDKFIASRAFAVRDMDTAVDFINANKGIRHVWVTSGVLSRMPQKRGAESDIGAVTFLHADLDIANPEAHSQTALPTTVDEALELLAGLPEPSYIIHTGNGLLPIWLLVAPLHDMAYAKSLLGGVQHHIRTAATARGWKLDGTADLARLVRVVGTFNHKTNPAKAVRVLAGTGTRHKPRAFEAFIAPRTTPRTRNVVSTITKDEAAEMLRFIPKQQAYEDWLRVLMALYNSFDYDTALELAENWSAGEPGEVERKFQSFENKNIDVSAGTLVWLARQHGYVPPFRHTDQGNAERLVFRHGDNIRFIYAENKWLVWDGKRWAVDNTGAVERLAKETIRAMHLEAYKTTNDAKRLELADWALKSENTQRREQMIRTARTEAEIAIRPDQLDTNPWLLNVNNGTIDLQTGELLPHDPAHHITKLAPVDYNPDAKCPQWLAFLHRVMGGDAELISYIQRAVGYSLTGITSEQCLFFMFGSGKNGKSTFMETIMALLGDFQLKAPTSMLMLKRGESVPNDVAALSRGARFVVAAELAEGGRMNESLVKDLTGNDTLTARFLHQEYIQFRPTHKLWMYGNHKPIIRGGDEGIWRRIRLVPFTVQIPEHERDNMLGQKLLAELPGILAWAVEGALKWQAEGLGMPVAIKTAVDEYRAEMDNIGNFIEEFCMLKPGATTKKADLYNAYTAWCQQYGELPLAHKAFSLRMQERGFEDTRGTKGVRMWIGLWVRDDAMPGVWQGGTTNTSVDDLFGHVKAAASAA